MSLSLRAASFGILILSASLAPGQTAPPAPRGEEMKLPADAILVLYDKAADALRALPRFYVLAPERYAALLAEIDRLNKQLEARQPSPISTWRVTGKVKSSVVELKAVFSFVTYRDRAVVSLGCSRAQRTAIALDGKVPPVWDGGAGNEGLLLEVENAGKHEAVVEMLVPLRELSLPSPPARAGLPGGTVQGFEVDLPMTPVTFAEIDLPGGLKSLEVNDRPLDETLTVTGNRLAGPLGRVNKVKLSWKAAQALAGPQPVLTARGRITVNLKEEGQAVTEAELTLQDLGRAANNWQLQLPERAQVRLLDPADRKRLSADIPGGELPDGRITIALASPSNEPLTIRVLVRRPRGSGPVPVGPFAVVGAVTQSGDITVEADADRRVLCKPFQPARTAFTTTPRSLDDRAPANAVAAFRYSTQTSTVRADDRDPWFKLDVDSIQGLLDTSITHSLSLGPKGPADWHLKSVLDVTPLRAEVERMDLDWPAPWLLDPERGPSATGATVSFKEDVGHRQMRLDLDTVALKPFKLTLEALAAEADVRGGAIPQAVDSPAASAVFKLPRPRPPSARDRGRHEIVFTVPGETLDLRVPQPVNPGLELASQEPHKLVWRAERFVSQVAVAWKPYRADLSSDSVVDVTLAGNDVKVEHNLKLVFEETKRLPDSVLLRVPAAVKWLRRVIDGKKEEDLLAGDEPGDLRRGPGTERLIRCPLAAVRGDPTTTGRLLLKYGASVPGTKSGNEPLQRLMPVPLVAVAAATHGQARVRVWADPASQVDAPQGSSWEKPGLETVPERKDMPSLVLFSQYPNRPLTLRVDSSPARAGVPTIILERALFQVRVNEGGFQQYRMRFLVRQFGATRLDLAFPAPLAALNDLVVTLDGVDLKGEPLDSPSVAASDAEPGDSRRAGPFVSRLTLPAAALTRPAALEVTYHLLPNRGGFGSQWQSVLQPVTIPGLLRGVPVRWQVDLPANWVVLPLDGDASWRWGRRGWLLAPKPAVNNADLERWFWGEGDSRAALPEDEATLVPAHVCWRAGLAPLTLYHVPQQAWLLVCSLLILVVGLALGQAAFRNVTRDGHRSRLVWSVLSLLALAGAAVGLIWPGLLTVLLYGGQPGLAVLLVVLSVQWLLHERYRRRVVFLPGFRRVKTGSSLGRAGRPEMPIVPPGSGQEGKASSGSNRGRPVRAEPSTVDAPLPPGT